MAGIVFADISCRLFRRALNGRTKSTRAFVPSPYPVPSVRFRDRAPIVEVAASVVGVSRDVRGQEREIPGNFPSYARTAVREEAGWVAPSDGINRDSSLATRANRRQPSPAAVVSVISSYEIVQECVARSPLSIATNSTLGGGVEGRGARGRILSAKLTIGIEIPSVRVRQIYARLRLQFLA